MGINVYTPLMHEVLEKVAKMKTKKDKVSYLRENQNDAISHPLTLKSNGYCQMVMFRM